MDYGARYDRNIRIKAFTNDIPDEELVDPFADIEKDNPKWKYDAALYVFNNGYMTGKAMSDDGHVVFSPDTPITRSQFVQVLYSIEGKPEVSYEEIFDDVPDGKWYTSPVIWAVLNDIVTGKGSIFDVDGAANREQIAAIFYKYAIYKELDVSVDPEGKTLIHSVSTQPGEQATWLYEPKTYKVKVSAIQASWNLHIETLDDFKAGERK